MLAWIDLETTGLNPARDVVLEVACIVTDDQLNEVARFQRVLWTPLEYQHLTPFIQEMHTANGLWAEVKGPESHERWAVENELVTFLEHFAQGAQLAGSTISFDREFLRHHFPRVLDVLHYRNLDVSTLNEVARRFWPELHGSRPNNPVKAHRAMDDLEESIRVARHYIDRLAYVVEEGPASPAGEPIA